jgi:hypothetical protein
LPSRIYLFEALAFGALYFVYVCVVVIGRRIYQRRKLLAKMDKEVLLTRPSS